MNINDENKQPELSHDEIRNNPELLDKEFQESDQGIISVNDRGDQDDGMAKKIAFIVVVAILLIVAIIFGINKFTGNKEADELAEAAKNKPDPELNSINKRRDFTNVDPAVPVAEQPIPLAAGNLTASVCMDQSIPKQAVSPDGKPFLRNGQFVFVCNNGEQILRRPDGVSSMSAASPQPQNYSIAPPQQQQPVPAQMQPYLAQQQQKPSKYSGAIFVNERSNNNGSLGGMASNLDARTQQAYNRVTDIMRVADNQNVTGAGGNTGFGGGAGSGFSNEDDESIDEDVPVQATRAQATRANTNMAQLSANHAQARFIGDRNFLLAKGRVIKCNLSTKVVSEVGGMAACVIPQPVYSENGKVVLAEAGSEVIGEYKSVSTQGQRRLNILWTRLKTPHGVIVDLDSPASDALGTAGIGGKVDNRWGARIGAAFMLSLVQDAISYSIAKETEGSNEPYILQNTSETGKSMAETVLNSTINIKPTIFTRQGDIASIFVAKDIDFRGVYELKAK